MRGGNEEKSDPSQARWNVGTGHFQHCLQRTDYENFFPSDCSAVDLEHGHKSGEETNIIASD